MKGVAIESGDILLNTTGDSVARCCQVPDDVLPARVNQHVSIIRPDQSKLHPRFLMYFLVSPLMQATMLSLAGSVGTRKALTKTMVERFRLPVPDLSVQRKIAWLLSAYDDLIENNRRRIALLEQAARSFTGSGSSGSAFPATRTLGSSMACRRDGNGKLSQMSVCPSTTVTGSRARTKEERIFGYFRFQTSGTTNSWKLGTTAGSLRKHSGIYDVTKSFPVTFSYPECPSQ